MTNKTGSCFTCKRLECTQPSTKKNHPDNGCFNWTTKEARIILKNAPRFDDVFRPSPQIEMF